MCVTSPGLGEARPSVSVCVGVYVCVSMSRRARGGQAPSVCVYLCVCVYMSPRFRGGQALNCVCVCVCVCVHEPWGWGKPGTECVCVCVCVYMSLGLWEGRPNACVYTSPQARRGQTLSVSVYVSVCVYTNLGLGEARPCVCAHTHAGTSMWSVCGGVCVCVCAQVCLYRPCIAWLPFGELGPACPLPLKLGVCPLLQPRSKASRLPVHGDSASVPHLRAASQSRSGH